MGPSVEWRPSRASASPGEGNVAHALWSASGEATLMVGIGGGVPGV